MYVYTQDTGHLSRDIAVEFLTLITAKKVGAGKIFSVKFQPPTECASLGNNDITNETTLDYGGIKVSVVKGRVQRSKFKICLFKGHLGSEYRGRLSDRLTCSLRVVVSRKCLV